jgi:hypothetical protein
VKLATPIIWKSKFKVLEKWPLPVAVGWPAHESPADPQDSRQRFSFVICTRAYRQERFAIATVFSLSVGSRRTRGIHLMLQTNLLLPGRNLDIAGWKQLYETAILEIDNSKLPKRIAEARRAILDRAEEIQTNPPSDERHALNNALRTLRLLDEVAAREGSSAA